MSAEELCECFGCTFRKYGYLPTSLLQLNTNCGLKKEDYIRELLKETQEMLQTVKPIRSLKRFADFALDDLCNLINKNGYCIEAINNCGRLGAIEIIYASKDLILQKP